jgi:hypothetical protein
MPSKVKMRISHEASEYCSSKLYVSGKNLQAEVVTEALGIEPDRVRPSEGRKLTAKNQGLWRKAIDKEKESWDVFVQLEYWCTLLKRHKKGLATLRRLGYEIEIDCYISHGPVALIHLSPELLADLGSLNVTLSLGFYDITGKP